MSIFLCCVLPSSLLSFILHSQSSFPDGYCCPHSATGHSLSNIIIIFSTSFSLLVLLLFLNYGTSFSQFTVPSILNITLPTSAMFFTALPITRQLISWLFLRYSMEILSLVLTCFSVSTCSPAFYQPKIIHVKQSETLH